MKNIYLKMLGLVFIGAISFAILATMLVDNGSKAYTEYTQKEDENKKKCFEQYNTFKFEVVDNELYCLTKDGIRKWEKGEQ